MVARNASLRVIGEVLAKLASFAFFVVMARELGQREFGQFSFALSLAILLTVLSGFGIDNIMTRAIARDRAQIGVLFHNALLVKGAFGGLGVIAAVVIALAGGYDAAVGLTLVLLALACVVEQMAKTANATFLGLDDTGPAALGLIIQRFSVAAVAIPALLAGAGAATAAAIYLGGTALGFVYGWARMIGRGVWPRVWVSLPAARLLVTGSFALGLTGIFNVALFRIDMTMVSFYKGPEAVGAYGAAYRLLESTLFVSFAFGAAMLPGLSRLSRTTVPTVADAFGRALKVIATLLFPLGAAFALFAGTLMDLVYGDEYADAVTAARLLGGAVALYGIVSVAGSVIVSQDRQRMFPAIVGGALVFNVALNVLFIPRYSFEGAAAITSASELVVSAATVLYAARVTGRIAVVRTTLSPLAGVLAMGLVALATGDGLAGLAASLAAYAAVVLAVERLVYPEDLRRTTAAILRRRVVTAS